MQCTSVLDTCPNVPTWLGRRKWPTITTRSRRDFSADSPVHMAFAKHFSSPLRRSESCWLAKAGVETAMPGLVPAWQIQLSTAENFSSNGAKPTLAKPTKSSAISMNDVSIIFVPTLKYFTSPLPLTFLNVDDTKATQKRRYRGSYSYHCSNFNSYQGAVYIHVAKRLETTNGP